MYLPIRCSIKHTQWRSGKQHHFIGLSKTFHWLMDTDFDLWLLFGQIHSGYMLNICGYYLTLGTIFYLGSPQGLLRYSHDVDVSFRALLFLLLSAMETPYGCSVSHHGSAKYPAKETWIYWVCSSQMVRLLYQPNMMCMCPQLHIQTNIKRSRTHANVATGSICHTLSAVVACSYI